MKLMKVISAAFALLLSCLGMSAQNPAADGLGGMQWAVFTVSPENAILTIDGAATFPIRDGVLQTMLAPGMHTYLCESPYYEPLAGEFELKDDRRVDLSISLVPTFGYVTVNSSQKKADIILDGENIGKGKAGSGRVMAGTHTIMLVKDVTCLYRATFDLERGERKTFNISNYDLTAVPMAEILAESGMTESGAGLEDDGLGGSWGGINVHSNIAGAEVLVNGLGSGTAPCIIKPLRAGQPCRVTLKFAGYKDATKMVKVKSGEVTDAEFRLKKKRR